MFKPSIFDGLLYLFNKLINELKTFQKTSLLNPNSDDNISLHINYEDLRYWDEDSNSWKLEEGEYLINVGNSSRNISLSEMFKI